MRGRILIHVNGDHHLENLRNEDRPEGWLIGEVFPKLMWECCERTGQAFVVWL